MLSNESTIFSKRNLSKLTRASSFYVYIKF